MVSLKRVAVNGLMSRWRSIRSGVPQGLVLGWALFNVFVGGIDSGMKCILSQFAVHTKLCGPVNMPERKDAIQRDLDRFERWDCANLMRPSARSCLRIQAIQTQIQAGRRKN